MIRISKRWRQWRCRDHRYVYYGIGTFCVDCSKQAPPLIDAVLRLDDTMARLVSLTKAATTTHR